MMWHENMLMRALPEAERRALYATPSRPVLPINPPARPVHDTPKQQAERAYGTIVARCQELTENLSDGDQLVVSFKSGEDCLHVAKVSLDGYHLKLEGKDVNGNDTVVVITPNDLHYFQFTVEKKPGDGPKYGFGSV